MCSKVTCRVSPRVGETSGEEWALRAGGNAAAASAAAALANTGKCRGMRMERGEVGWRREHNVNFALTASIAMAKMSQHTRIVRTVQHLL